MKLDNFRRHLERVHPRAKVEDYIGETAPLPRRPAPALERRIRRRRLLSALLIIGLVGVSITLYGLALRSHSGPHPSIQVAPASYDFGSIPPEVVATTFTVMNIGEGELVILSIATSCMCTSAVFRFKGRESPTFGAHGNPEGWSERLEPQESGQLEVTYDPNLHPDSGPITRVVYIRSNDPSTSEVQLTITAYVVRG
ncbi:MAG: DUF1573 domain-containing protein [Thermoplasmata archaeon]